MCALTFILGFLSCCPSGNSKNQMPRHKSFCRIGSSQRSVFSILHNLGAMELLRLCKMQNKCQECRKVLSEHVFRQGCLSPHDSQGVTQYLAFLSYIHLCHREGLGWASFEIRMRLLHSLPCPSPLRSRTLVQLLNKQDEIMPHYHNSQYIIQYKVTLLKLLH